MLARLFAKKPSEPVPESAALSPPPIGQMLLTDLEKVENLPTLSDTAVRAMAMTNDPNASLADLGDLIRRDSILTAATLKLANSGTYRAKQTTENVQQAVVRLGFMECARVVTMVGMREMYTSRDRRVAQACDTLLKHAFFVASLTTAINKRFGLGFTGEEYSAALLHDIGRVVLCYKAPELFNRIDHLHYEDQALLEREREILKTDHCMIGSMFAVKNELPKPIGRAILNHHRPGVEHECRALVALIAAADELANFTQEHRHLRGFPLQQSAGFRILMSNWNPARVAEMKDALPSIVVRAVKETRGLCKSIE